MSFDPTAVAPGSQPFTYSFTSTDGCTSIATGFVEVRENPTVSIGSFTDSVCIGLAAVACPVASPAGGEYSGNGINGVLLEPQVAGIGQHTVTYTFVDVYGCSGTSSTDANVVDCTPLSAEPAMGATGTWTAFPNPNSGTFRIEHTYTGNVTARIYSVTGALVHHIPVLAANQQVVLPETAPGVYMLQLIGDDVSDMQRIVVR